MAVQRYTALIQRFIVFKLFVAAFLRRSLSGLQLLCSPNCLWQIGKMLALHSVPLRQAGRRGLLTA